jgi:hypothetical protein
LLVHCYVLVFELAAKQISRLLTEWSVPVGIMARLRKGILPLQKESCPSNVALCWLGALVALVLSMALGVSSVLASPPFKTDDPEPVEYQHWEINIASQYANDRDGVSSTAPHFEVNYGLRPNVELHLLVPFSYDRPRGGPTLYGLGDVELGVKYRFVQETSKVPMVAISPMVHLPSGNSSRGLGAGEPQLFLPLWLEKSWVPWQTYGGGGYWINPGDHNQNYWFFGWQVQRQIADWLAVGAEIFYQTPPVRYGKYETGYTVGAIIDFTENHHLLCSVGSDIRGPNLFSYYLAYQWTWGPKETKK